MTSTKYIGMDVHKESISIAVMNSVGKVVMECVIETKAREPAVVDKPQSTRVEEPTLLCNQVPYHYFTG
jgi:hypothetical protein